MPLLDHFHPPWLKQRPWDSFHAAWANALAEQLNDGVLPPSFVALPFTQLGGRIEVDVAAVNGAAGTPEGGAATAVWAPPQPSLQAAIEFTHLDVFEVRVQRDDDSPRWWRRLSWLATPTRTGPPIDALSPSSAPAICSKASAWSWSMS